MAKKWLTLITERVTQRQQVVPYPYEPVHVHMVHDAPLTFINPKALLDNGHDYNRSKKDRIIRISAMPNDTLKIAILCGDTCRVCKKKADFQARAALLRCPNCGKRIPITER